MIPTLEVTPTPVSSLPSHYFMHPSSPCASVQIFLSDYWFQFAISNPTSVSIVSNYIDDRKPLIITIKRNKNCTEVFK